MSLVFCALYEKNIGIYKSTSLLCLTYSSLGSMVNNYPSSRIAQLATSSIWYTNVNCSCPSDSMPGTVALATGASSKTHGMWYDTAYSRALYAPLNAGGTVDCSGPPGTDTNYDESIDLLYNPSLQYTVTNSNGGCTTYNGVGGCGINTDALPRKLLANGSCVPWYPHNEVRVNTVYEVAKAGNYITLFSDKHLSYEV